MQRGGAMAVAVGLAGVGLVLLIVAADQLVVGAGRLATRLRVAPVVVGVVVIGVGTSSPELLVSSVAAAQGETGIAVGNLVGSNIINVTLILGLSALVAPIAVKATVLRREAPLSVAAVAVFAALTATGLGLARGVGLALAVATVTVLGLLVWLSRTAPAGPLPAGAV